MYFEVRDDALNKNRKAQPPGKIHGFDKNKSKGFYSIKAAIDKINTT